MNTIRDLPPENVFDPKPSPDPKLLETISQLENSLQANNSERRTERFFWIFLSTSFLNVIIGSLAPGPVWSIFLILSIILLIGCARWMEIPWIVTHLERLFNRLIGGRSAVPEIEPPP